MPRPRLVVVSIQGRAGLPAGRAAHLEHVAEVTYARRFAPMAAADARAVLRAADIVAVTPKVMPAFDEPLLCALPGLRTIVLHATGFEAFDLDLLDRCGVELVTLPDYSTESVAEHALGLVLAMATRAHLANDRSRGLAPPSTSLRGFELAGRTLGVIGLGRIGGHLADLGRAIGMRVVATDVVPRSRAGVATTDLAGLLATADVIALTCPLVRGAPPVLGPAQLGAVRPGAVLVNVGRPELVDGGAVLAALGSGRLRGYAVDDAPFGPEAARLVAEGRVLQTGHRAWWTDESLARGAAQWGDAMVGAAERWVSAGREPAARMAG